MRVSMNERFSLYRQMIYADAALGRAQCSAGYNRFSSNLSNTSTVGETLVILLRDAMIMAILTWCHVVPAYKGATKAHRFAVVQ